MTDKPPYRPAWMPQRIRGKQTVAGKMLQVIGGKRWSLVLMWDMEPPAPSAQED